MGCLSYLESLGPKQTSVSARFLLLNFFVKLKCPKWKWFQICIEKYYLTKWKFSIVIRNPLQIVYVVPIGVFKQTFPSLIHHLTEKIQHNFQKLFFHSASTHVFIFAAIYKLDFKWFENKTMQCWINFLSFFNSQNDTNNEFIWWYYPPLPFYV